MTHTLLPLYAQKLEHAIGAVCIEKPKQFSALIDGFDVLVIFVTDRASDSCTTYHYNSNQSYVQERWYHRSSLEALMSPAGNRELQQLFMAGDIVWDTQDYLQSLRQKMLAYNEHHLKHQRFQEFCLFLRHFILSRNDLAAGDILDAHSQILLAVHHWAKIAVIEQGHLPGLTLWRQVKQMNPGIFKIYEELTTNMETLEQRVKLAHLAGDFSVLSKMKEYCEPLLNILSSRAQAWNIAELESHPDLSAIQTELHMVLRKLVRRSLIFEVLSRSHQPDNMLEVRYISRKL
jgi:hypothetical protein